MSHKILIDKFIQGQLNEEEKTIFEQLLNDDPDFNQEVEFMLHLKQAIKINEEKQIKKHLKKIEQKQKNKKIWQWISGIAASIIILLSSIIWYERPSKMNQIFEEYYTTYPNIISPEVRSLTQENSLTSKAFILYDSGKYDEASALFYESYLMDSTEHLLFYYAMSLLAIDNTEKAINVLENHHFNHEQRFNEIAEWYLALGYLKTNQSELAKEHLKHITSSHQYKAKEAQEILEKLK